jgi:putative transposase
MAAADSSAMCRALDRVLAPDEVYEAALRLGVVKRQRTFSISVFVAMVVLSFHVGATRSLEGLRQVYEQVSGHTLCRSAFYDRWTASLATLLRERVQALLSQPGPTATLPSGALSQFRELLALDATVLRLHALLASAFPACRTNHTKACAKLHVVANVFDGRASRVKLTSERVSDTAPWRRVEDWVRGCLLLFDLGYYRFHLFDRIDAHGGFFLTRAKSTFNPLITQVHRRWRGRSIAVVGHKLRDVLPRLQRAILDIEAEFVFDKRAYKGAVGQRRRTFRVVAILNEQTDEYHVYITNVPADRLPAEDIRSTYSLRWQVELLFKSWKSYGRLDHLHTANPIVVECLVWASLLTALASHALHHTVRSAVAKDRHLPLLRWAALFSRVALELLQLFFRRDPARERNLWQLLCREAPDPNRLRKRAFQQAPVALDD